MESASFSGLLLLGQELSVPCKSEIGRPINKTVAVGGAYAFEISHVDTLYSFEQCVLRRLLGFVVDEIYLLVRVRKERRFDIEHVVSTAALA